MENVFTIRRPVRCGYRLNAGKRLVIGVCQRSAGINVFIKVRKFYAQDGSLNGIQPAATAGWIPLSQPSRCGSFKPSMAGSRECIIICHDSTTIAITA